MRVFGFLHDRLTTLSAWLGAACIGIIAFSYCWEVTARYLFNAPTFWVSPVTTYLLLVGVMLMFPYVTQQRSHVVITFLHEMAGPRRARYLLALCIVVSAAVCLLSVWFTATETHRQLVRNVRMMDTMLVPKWWLSAFLVYGFLSAGLHFVRQIGPALAGEPVPAASSEH